MDSWRILEFRAASLDLSLGEGGGVDPSLVSSSLDHEDGEVSGKGEKATRKQGW